MNNIAPLVESKKDLPQVVESSLLHTADENHVLPAPDPDYAVSEVVNDAYEAGNAVVLVAAFETEISQVILHGPCSY